MFDPIDRHRLEETHQAPGFVKEASLPTKEELGSLPTQCFADPERKFPIHTKVATWFSCADFWEDALFDESARPETGEQLLKAADYWEIGDSVRDLLKRVAESGLEKSAEDLPDDCFALVVSKDGSKLRKYPITDSELVEKSAQDLYDERTLLPMEWRKYAASNILKKAEEYNTVIDDDEHADYLERAAGKGLSSLDTVIQGINKRSEALRTTKRTEKAKELDKVASKLKEKTLDRETLEKTASFLDQVDRDTNLYERYNNDLPLPEEYCHAILRKHAEEALDQMVQLPNGSVYAKSDLEKAGSEVFSVLPGREHDVKKLDGNFDMEKAASVSKELKKDEAILLDGALGAAGIKPRNIQDFQDILKELY